MHIHEFGSDNQKTVLLIHPSVVRWDYFSTVIPLLEKRYHLLVPALPGYDREEPGEDYTSVEEIAGELEKILLARGMKQVACAYGCSMGGSILLRMLADHRVFFGAAVCDGGITPYQPLYLFTRLIAVRDFLMVSLGKAGGTKLLKRVFPAEEFGEQSASYVAEVLHTMSAKTIWRTFDSCNNYEMPERVRGSFSCLQYWFGEREEKDRSWDIRYVAAHFPDAELIRMKGLGHAEMAVRHPGMMAAALTQLAERHGT